MNGFGNSGVGAVVAGKKAEEQFVIELNGDKKDPRWQTLGIKNAEEYFAIRVTKKVPSKKLGHLANAKADVYIASGKLEQSLLEKKKFFLNPRLDEVKKFPEIFSQALMINHHN